MFSVLFRGFLFISSGFDVEVLRSLWVIVFKVVLKMGGFMKLIIILVVVVVIEFLTDILL